MTAPDRSPAAPASSTRRDSPHGWPLRPARDYLHACAKVEQRIAWCERRIAAWHGELARPCEANRRRKIERWLAEDESALATWRAHGPSLYDFPRAPERLEK